MRTTSEQADVLFISENPIWPLDQGYRVHGYHMAKALHELGVSVAVSCMSRLPMDVPMGLQEMAVAWPKASGGDIQRFKQGWSGWGSWGRRRFARYQGLDVKRLAGVLGLVDRLKPRWVIGLGQHSPVMLHALKGHLGVKRVWYAADEPMYFQASCMAREPLKSVPGRLIKIGVYGALEGLFVRGLDGAIGVNPTDTRLLGLVGGVKQAVTIRNGVDTERFKPGVNSEHKREENSVVFWGRMDFEPNIDAVQWFANRVWPQLVKRCPGAIFRIVGKYPVEEVKRLSAVDGIEVVGAVADVRGYAKQAGAVVLPMRCGGGIKNKLLEAAAMGCPIVASAKALRGLEINERCQPTVVCRSVDQWVGAIQKLWSDRAYAQQLGKNAVSWVHEKHQWSDAAKSLCGWLASLGDRGGGVRLGGDRHRGGREIMGVTTGAKVARSHELSGLKKRAA